MLARNSDSIVHDLDRGRVVVALEEIRAVDERDRARFAKAQSYMVRRDDAVGCKNVRCRKRFEVTTLQTVAFL